MESVLDMDDIAEKIPNTFKVGGTLTSVDQYRCTLNITCDVKPAPSHIHMIIHIHTHTHSQVPLEETLQKRLEYEFHSASYHTMMEVVNGLKIAARHLIKVQLVATVTSMIISSFLILSLTTSIILFLFPQGHY